jgi:HAE1 family hydrophobic/amphiphilic exporter-1
MMPIMFLSVTAKENYDGIYELLDEKMANPLNRIDGVGSVTIGGAPTREVQVNVDPQKMEAYRLTIEQIGQIIAAENRNIPAGAMDIGSERMSLRINAEFSQSQQLKNVVVANIGGKEIKISDIATVRDTIKKMTVENTANGQKAVRVLVQKQSGANSVAICEAVRKMLPEIQKTMPKDVQVQVFFDTSEYITDSINSLTETVMYAFLFVILVVLIFLGRWRATIIICLTIPLSLLTSFIYLMIAGGTLNVISLSSLAIAIGMVVDDAIVVLENITKHLERKARPNDAAVYGTNEVWMSVIGATLTIIAVFLPLTMVGGIAGIMFKQLGWIVTIVITTSVVAAVTITPMLSARMLRFRAEHTYKGIGLVYKPIDAALSWLDRAYARLLGWAVRHKTMVIVSALLIFVASIFLFSQVPTDFMPESDDGRVEMKVEFPVNYNLDETTALAHRIEKVFVDSIPEIKYLSVNSGASDEGGFAALMGNSGMNQVAFSLTLTKATERQRSKQEVSDVMRRILDRVPEIEKYGASGGMGNMMGGGSTVEVKIFGYNFEQTNAVANELLAKMKTIPGARDVASSREKMKVEMVVDFDREKLAKFGSNTATAATYVRNRINGLTASLYREDGDEYDIIVRYDESFRTSVADVQNILLYNSAGQAIRLNEVATVVERFTPPIIEREDRQRVVTVSAALAPGAALGEVAAEAKEKIAELTVPAGVAIAMSGSVEDQQESFMDLLTLMALIILLVYIVMAAQFESLGLPLIIMVSILFAFTGVFLALWITNTSLSMIALIGAIMLVGIVVKNGIVIVDFTNLQRERGVGLKDSVISAGKSRLRPVLMTTLTTVLGMIPLAVGSGEGSEMWKPMGVAIIGGLSFSTVLTLLVVPTMYAAFNFGRGKKVRKANRVEATVES